MVGAVALGWQRSHRSSTPLSLNSFLVSPHSAWQAPASCFRKFVYRHIGRWHGLAQIHMQILF
eukprot:SAG11_NODE_7619_length_1120_cov_2.949070_2_plen_62_part_01